MNEEVSLLALLDTYPPARTRGRSDEHSKEELSAAITDETVRKMLDGLGSDGHVLSPLSPHDYDAVKNVCASNVRIIST